MASGGYFDLVLQHSLQLKTTQAYIMFSNCLAFLQIANFNVVFVLGKPLDLMARRVLAAGTKELALELSTYLESIDLPRD